MPHRSINLSSNHYRVVTWREHIPSEKPEPNGFDFDECSQQLRRIHDQHLDTRKVPINHLRSPEEARFWAIAIINKSNTLEATLAQLAEIDYAGDPQIDDLVEPFWQFALHGSERPLFKCIATMLSPDHLVHFMVKVENAGTPNWDTVKIGNLFREIALPSLDSAGIAKFREIVRPRIAGRSLSHRSKVPAEFLIAAAVGCHKEIADLVAKLPADIFDFWPSLDDETTTIEWVIFGLPDRETLIVEARRLGLRMLAPESIKAWLALTEWHALDVIADTICWLKDKKHASILAKQIHLVRAPEMALPALRIASNSKAKEVGQRWLENNPSETAIGLIGAGIGRQKNGKLAREHLISNIEDGGFKSALFAAGESLGPKAVKWLNDKILPEGEVEIDGKIEPGQLTAILPPPGAKKLPTWYDFESLHAIDTPDGPLSDSQLRSLSLILKASPLEKKSPLLDKIKHRSDEEELDLFAASLLKLWLDDGADMRDKWVIEATGHIGGERCALLLAPTIQRWPDEGLHQRAKLGLRCLGAMGNNPALSALCDIAARIKHKGLRSHAQELLENIARRRNFTPSDLEDQTVPQCGIDHYGKRTFTLGTRRFEFVAGPNLRPQLRDSDGKLTDNLPDARRDDNPKQAAQELAEWTAFKTNFLATIKSQTARLKRLFVTARRWTPDEFTNLVLGHPIMRSLAQQLIFASHNDIGELTATFRIAEDWSLANQAEEPFELPATGDIRIAHPVYLGNACIQSWQEIQSDHGIIPPFKQLDHPVSHPAQDMLDQPEIQFGDRLVDPVIKNGMLKRIGWKFQSTDQGNTICHSLHFESAKLIAYIHCTRKGLSLLEDGEKLHSAYFIDQRPSMGRQRSATIREVDGAILSEVLRTTCAIIAKAAMK